MTLAAFDPGTVRLTLRWEHGRSRDVAVASTRPNVAAALGGREADAAVRMLPLLYSLCGTAQGLAARLALAAARGTPAAPAVDAAVLAEGRREHLWRLLLDWPELLGLPREQALFVEGRRQAAEAGFGDWAAQALAGPLARIADALSALPDPAPAAGMRFLPALTAAATLSPWPRLDAAFAAAPAWDGAAAETGALARHGALRHLPPALARLKARIAELGQSAGLGLASAVPLAAGVGRALVETARGLLMHEIALDGDRIADYVVVAPTEWNFRPTGPLCGWLAGVAAATPAELRALAQRAVLALDPCVPSQIDLSATGGAS